MQKACTHYRARTRTHHSSCPSGGQCTQLSSTRTPTSSKQSGRHFSAPTFSLYSLSFCPAGFRLVGLDGESTMTAAPEVISIQTQGSFPCWVYAHLFTPLLAYELPGMSSLLSRHAWCHSSGLGSHLIPRTHQRYDDCDAPQKKRESFLRMHGHIWPSAFKLLTTSPPQYTQLDCWDHWRRRRWWCDDENCAF